jgi:putative addiction module killer protein
MKEIRKSSVYDKWLKKMQDARAIARIRERIKRLSEGNPGDNRFLGDISEM